METGWKVIKRVYKQYSTRYDDKVAAQQVFYRLVWWLYELMPEEEARKFMMQVVDPDPIIDWETGLSMGDPCLRHPDQKLSSLPIPSNNQYHLECPKCSL